MFEEKTNAAGILRPVDILVAAVVGAVVCVTVSVWCIPGLDPSLWDETAVVAGLRPPRTIFPGFWRILCGWIFAMFGIDSAVSLLSVCGAVLGGICAGITCLIVRQTLGLLIRTERVYPVWTRCIAPLFSAASALFLGFSDPFVRMFQVVSPDALRFLLFIVSAQLLLRWFAVGGNWRIFVMMSIMGFMGAETPFAFLLPAAFALAYRIYWHLIVDGVVEQPESMPDPEEMPKWRMFFLFLGALAFGIWVNGAEFVLLGGLEANGWHSGDIYFRYAAGYWHVLADAATLLGWVLGIAFGVIPLVVALRVVPLTARDDRPMIFNLGVVLFFVVAMGAMQCGAFPSARFWTYSREMVMVHSGFLLTFFVFCSVVALGLGGAAFAFECQRTYLDEDNPKPGVLLRWIVPALAVGLLTLAALRIPKPIETEMQRIVDDAVAETVEECGDAKFLFTDGHYDAAIELVAAKLGRPLRTLNMMSGPSEWDINQRRRLFDPADEDYKIAETGVPALLRVWAGEKPGGMDESAIQLGFEFWKREKRPLPRLSGMIAREKGLSEEDAAKGIERSKALSQRILDISRRLDDADPSPELAAALASISWRLARLARMREDLQLADSLDESNTILKRMLSILEQERLRTFMQMTPREGLQLALRRANFAEARRYSAVVLSYDEDDPEANFAMGMSSLEMKQMKDAERYLRRVLKRRPNEPAVLNNLSIICRKQKRWKEAEDFARKAIKILPDVPEVKQTLADALKKAP